MRDIQYYGYTAVLKPLTTIISVKVDDCYESLKKLAGKLNHYHLKTAQEIEAAILKALTGNSDYFDYQIIEETQIVKKQNLCYKPGKNTKYEEKTKTTYHLEYQLNQETLNQASLLDAWFPIVHNVTFS